MTSADYDVIVIGQGLAGTAIAWSLYWSGTRFLVLDRDPESSSSKIAAGLITPITGQKLVTTWRHAELWPVALEFYRRVEQQTQMRFFDEPNMVRLFQNGGEAALFERRFACGEYQDLVRSCSPRIASGTFADTSGGFEMGPGGQLKVEGYLAASRQFFRRIGCYRKLDLEVSADLELVPDGAVVHSIGVRAKRLIFCQGIESTVNPWFRDVQFRPAKGEILTVRIPRLIEDRVIHRGIWIVPVGEELFKVGSTYDWERLDSQPTAEGRSEITARLRDCLHVPFEVVAHEAAVRPIHLNQYPVVGWHPRYSQLGLFNGLGSKGTLHAPFFARQFVSHLLNGAPLDPSVDVCRKTEWQHEKSPTRRPVPLTQQAQAAVRAVAARGDTVIDATVGNGHDTQFLAELVGPSGVVYGFDIQPIALAKTSDRLSALDLTNVRLLEVDHLHLASSIPMTLHSRISAIMFNLGYLPGGDKEITTGVASTRQAIEQAALLLKAGGLLTIMAYTGHDGGMAESQVVESFVTQLRQDEFQFEIIESETGSRSGPRLFLVRRT